LFEHRSLAGEHNFAVASTIWDRRTLSKLSFFEDAVFIPSSGVEAATKSCWDMKKLFRGAADRVERQIQNFCEVHWEI